MVRWNRPGVCAVSGGRVVRGSPDAEVVEHRRGGSARAVAGNTDGNAGSGDGAGEWQGVACERPLDEWRGWKWRRWEHLCCFVGGRQLPGSHHKPCGEPTGDDGSSSFAGETDLGCLWADADEEVGRYVMTVLYNSGKADTENREQTAVLFAIVCEAVVDGPWDNPHGACEWL